MLPTSIGHNITYRFTKYTTNYMKNQNICTKLQEFLQQIFEIKQSRRNSYERGARINLLSTLGTQIFTWGSWKRKKPRVRRCKLLCGLLRGRAASLPKRTIVGRFRAVLGKLPVRRNRSRRKGRGRARPHPGHFCPQCGQFHGVCHRGRRTVLSAGGGVENRKSSAIAGKLAGSQLNFKEKSVVFAAQKLTRHRQRIGLAELITFS